MTNEKNRLQIFDKVQQSLTIGTIAFEGYFAFDLLSEYDKQALLLLLQNTEKVFQDAG